MATPTPLPNPEILLGHQEVEHTVESPENLDRRVAFSTILGQVAMIRAGVTAESLMRMEAVDLKAKSLAKSLGISGDLPEELYREVDPEPGVTFDALQRQKATPYNQEVKPTTLAEKFAAHRLDKKLAKHHMRITDERRVHLQQAFSPGKVRVRATKRNRRQGVRAVERSYRAGDITNEERQRLIGKAGVEALEHDMPKPLEVARRRTNRSVKSLQRYGAIRGVSFRVPPRSDKNIHGDPNIFHNPEKTVQKLLRDKRVRGSVMERDSTRMHLDDLEKSGSNEHRLAQTENKKKFKSKNSRPNGATQVRQQPQTN